MIKIKDKIYGEPNDKNSVRWSGDEGDEYIVGSPMISTVGARGVAPYPPQFLNKTNNDSVLVMRSKSRGSTIRMIEVGSGQKIYDLGSEIIVGD